MKTPQEKFWLGEFGEKYTERNTYTVDELNDFYLNNFGITRIGMNTQTLRDLTFDSVLEVGCNVGNQLRCLQRMGYNNLKGIELQHTAVEKAMRICKDISVVQGSAFDLPFDNGQFDMVFTSGVLIHIAPSELDKIMDEMFRVTNKYIWGFEYFSDEHTEVNYRGNMDKLWKGNFMKLFLNRFPELSVVKDLRFKYLNGENIDQMYVLEKTG